MITEKEVEQAIKECLREPVTGGKRAVLADLYNHTGLPFRRAYASAGSPTANTDAVLLSTDDGTGRNIHRNKRRQRISEGG